MRSILSFLFLFISSFNILDAQIFPREDSKLCYRIIGFAFPAEKGAVKYTIEIAKGTFTTDNDFEKNIVSSVSSTTNKKIAEVPLFGCEYTWRVAINNKSTTTKSALHHFATKITADVDSNLTRFRIMKSAEKYKDAYVFVDEPRALYDMNGKPVWFLPGSDLEVNRAAQTRDMKLSPQGTITFLTGGRPYEISYDGDVLWHFEGPESIAHTDTFNHEFTRLQNGHYMGFVSQNNFLPLPAFKDKIAHNAADSERYYNHTRINVLVEFDKNYKVIWGWNGGEYIKKSDLGTIRPTDTLFDPRDLHENAFYFDEQRKVIYICFRNISRVIKIKYPEGNVLNTYGTLYKPGIKSMKNDQFCWQHACKGSKKGNFYLYNNNECNAPHVPTVELFRETAAGNNRPEKIWEYDCDISEVSGLDDEDIEGMKKEGFLNGGNVVELADESMFVSMGGAYGKIFIVSKDKQIQWSGIVEFYDQVKKKWKPAGISYRASIITSRKDLERMIWNSEK